MRKIIPFLFFLFITMALFALDSEQYFHERSALYTFSNILIYKGNNESPKNIAQKIGFTEPAKNNVDYYISLIIDKYNLKMSKIAITDNNLNEVNSILESTAELVVVTYYKKNRSHCAMVAGKRMGPDSKIIGYLVNDSALEGKDFISSVDLVSQYWKSKIKSIYYFNK
jgi:hypothetical protein